MTDEWVSAIRSLDDEDTYVQRGEQSREHIEAMDIFSEATRIAGLAEEFSRQYPVARRAEQVQAKRVEPGALPVLREPPPGRVGFGFSNGRLRIQR